MLARKVGERLLIGDQIAVTVVKSGPGGVRLGIEAPPEMLVVRDEIASDLAEARGPQASVETPAASIRRPR
ncbi:MAG: carbon storage regulator [Planctomycetota bacterium]